MSLSDTIDEALARTSELREPCRIAVQMEGKYPRLVSVQFMQQQEAAA